MECNDNTIGKTAAAQRLIEFIVATFLIGKSKSKSIIRIYGTALPSFCGLIFLLLCFFFRFAERSFRRTKLRKNIKPSPSTRSLPFLQWKDHVEIVCSSSHLLEPYRAMTFYISRACHFPPRTRKQFLERGNSRNKTEDTTDVETFFKHFMRKQELANQEEKR
eukprot:c23687_g1_i5 orf=46-534(-)